jgi:hypothetical protein
MSGGTVTGHYGATITFRLLEWYPEPWMVVSISHPQLIHSDLIGRKPSGDRGADNRRRVPDPPEGRILSRLGLRHRWVRA